MIIFILFGNSNCGFSPLYKNTGSTQIFKNIDIQRNQNSLAFLIEEALEEMVMVAEGVRAARMFRDRAIDMGIEVPFVIALNTLLDNYIDAEECCRRMVALS